MMGYLLDTSIIIDYLRNKKEIVNYVDNIEEEVFSSYICVSELYIGVFRDNEPFRAEEKLQIYLKGLNGVLSLDDKTVRQYGQIAAELFKKGQTVGEMDALIAATCVANDLTLITKNPKHFSRIPGLKLVLP